jgi:hypothetical protein
MKSQRKKDFSPYSKSQNYRKSKPTSKEIRSRKRKIEIKKFTNSLSITISIRVSILSSHRLTRRRRQQRRASRRKRTNLIELTLKKKLSKSQLFTRNKHPKIRNPGINRKEIQVLRQLGAGKKENHRNKKI